MTKQIKEITLFVPGNQADQMTARYGVMALAAMIDGNPGSYSVPDFKNDEFEMVSAHAKQTAYDDFEWNDDSTLSEEEVRAMVTFRHFPTGLTINIPEYWDEDWKVEVPEGVCLTDVMARSMAAVRAESKVEVA